MTKPEILMIGPSIIRWCWIVCWMMLDRVLDDAGLCAGWCWIMLDRVLDGAGSCAGSIILAPKSASVYLGMMCFIFCTLTTLSQGREPSRTSIYFLQPYRYSSQNISWPGTRGVVPDSINKLKWYLIPIFKWGLNRHTRGDTRIENSKWYSMYIAQATALTVRLFEVVRYCTSWLTSVEGLAVDGRVGFPDARCKIFKIYKFIPPTCNACNHVIAFNTGISGSLNWVTLCATDLIRRSCARHSTGTVRDGARSDTDRCNVNALSSVPFAT